MNILAYVHLRNVRRISTGAGRVAKNIIEALHGLGEDEIQILADRADYARSSGQFDAPWTSFQYRLFGLDTSLQQRLWYLLDAPKAETYWPRAQVVYCTGESYVPTRSAALAVVVHDAAYFDGEALRRNLRFRAQQMRWRLLYLRLAKKADLFHTVSEFSAERLSHHFPSISKRLRVVPNAVTDFFFSSESGNDAEILSTFGLGNRRFLLLPRGLWYRKNGDLVVGAWSVLKQKHPELMLVITSHNDPHYVEKIKSVDPSVILTGFVSDEVLRALYRAAALLWFPSRYEGFGMPVIEAMACGTPVVASNAASIPEVAGNAALLVSPGQPAEHIAAIEHLLVDEGARSELVEQGRIRASGFTWRRSAQMLRSALGELV